MACCAAESNEVGAVVPDDVMTFVAGWFPLLSFAAGAMLYAWWRRVLLPSAIVLFGTGAAMYFRFTLHFWPWLLLYVMLSWLGSFAVWQWRTWQKERVHDRKP